MKKINRTESQREIYYVLRVRVCAGKNSNGFNELNIRTIIAKSFIL